MKKHCIILFVLFSLFLGPEVLSAQESPKNDKAVKNKWLRFGFQMEMNLSHYSLKTKEGFQDLMIPQEEMRRALYSINYYPVDYAGNDDVMGGRIKDVTALSIGKGGSWGVLCEMRMGEHVDLQLLINAGIGETIIQYEVIVLDHEGLPKDQVQLEAKSSAIVMEWPVLLKYRLLNDRLYLLGGINSLVMGQSLYENHMHSHGFDILFDMSADIGLGYDFCQFRNGVKLGVQIKYGIGLLNRIKGMEEKYPDCFYYFPLESVRSDQLKISFVVK